MDESKGLILEDAEHFSSHLAFTDTQHFTGLSSKFWTKSGAEGEGVMGKEEKKEKNKNITTELLTSKD